MKARRAVPLILAILLMAVGAGWVVPGILDWNRYRGAIAGFASDQLGRPVHIGGAVTLRLLPQPVLQAADVSIGDAGDGLGLHARALQLRVSLPSLLAGTIDTRELTVQGADLRLPWPLPQALVQQPRNWFTGLRAQVEDSRLQVGRLVLAGIAASLATDPDTGTLLVAGVGDVSLEAGSAAARRWRFTARLAQPGGDGAAGLDLSLDGQGPLQDTGGTFSGQIGADGALTGRVAGRGPDLSALLPAPSMPWRGDGRLMASGGLAVADELALEVGGAPARGTVALRVLPDARLDLAVAAGRLDLDAWLPALVAAAGGRRGIPTGLDISAEAATLAGGTLRQLRAAVDLGAAGEGGATLRDVSVVLPGEASLSLSGQLNGGASPVFTGAMRLGAPDLPATVRWAQPLLAPVFPGLPTPIAALPRVADVQARVVMGSAEAMVSDLNGTMDGSTVSGTARLAHGVRTALSADLVLAHLQLDAFLPDPALLPSMPWADALASLRAVDANIRLRAGAAEWTGTQLGALVIEVQTDASRVALRRLEAAPPGLRVTASGQVGDHGQVTDGKLDAAAPDLALLRPMLARLSALPSAAEPLLRGPGSLALTAAGPPEALAMRITADLGDLRLEAQPIVNIPARRAAGAVTLHHPGAPRLMNTFGLGGAAAWLGDGSFSLVGQVAVAPGRVEVPGATLTAGLLRVTGQMAWEGAHATGRLQADTLPLPLVYPGSPDPLPFGLLRGWSAAVRVDAKEVLAGLTPVLGHTGADLVLDGGTLRLEHLTGEALGGTVAGSLAVDAAADPPRVTVEGKAAGLGITGPVFGTPVDLTAGLAELGLRLSGAGYSPAALLATLSGAGEGTVREGIASGFDLAAVASALSVPNPADALAAARAALAAGSTPLGMFTAGLTVDRGAVAGTATLANPSGSGRLVGTLDLGSWSVDARLSLRPEPPPGSGQGPQVAVRLTGGSAGVTASPELAGLARWLAERPAAP